MATSGTVAYSLNGGQIVNKAFKLLGVGREGEALGAEEFADGLEALNLLTKTMQAEGVPLWKKASAILFPARNQAAYSLGLGGARAASSFAETRLTTAAISGAISLSVDSITGFANGQAIGVLLDTGYLHWTTISGAPSGSTITLATGLAASAATANPLFAYSALIARPLRILDMQRRNSSGTDVPMFKMAREDYRVLTNKMSSGSAIQWYYDPQLGQGTMYVWQPPSDERNTYRFTAYLPIQVFTATTDDPDCPDEWVETLCYNLAVRLMPSWGDDLAPNTQKLIFDTAIALKQTLRGWDNDDASLELQPYTGR